jgi:DNA-binding response OmpR family regulator
VLIVDDEPNIRFLFRVAFEAAGHEVEEASDGRVALDAVAAKRPDLVTTDYMMPVLDGGELIERLRADPATDDLPILLVSSSPGASRIAGADLFMQKPFDPRDLVERANALLGKDG